MSRERFPRRGISPVVPALCLFLAAGLTHHFASGAYRFVGRVLLAFAVLALLWGLGAYGSPAWKRALRGSAIVLAIAGAMCFAVLEGLVLAGDRTEIQEEPQVMVILGAQVKPWGPSVLLKDRLDTALDYWREHPELPLVVSGGQGSDEPMSEAQCMYDYLTEQGVPGEQIWMEENSRNTVQNFRETARLLEKRGMEPEETHILVVSNGFHLTRARMLADRNGFAHVSTLAAPSSDLPARVNSYVREAPALLKSWLLDR